MDALRFGTPYLGAPRRRRVNPADVEPEPEETVRVADGFDVEKVRRIAGHRIGMVHPEDEGNS